MDDIRHSFAEQGLIRPREGRVLGGVIAGLGRRFGIEPWPARLLFVLLLMVIPGSPILIYPILWILMPSEDTLTTCTDGPLNSGPLPLGGYGPHRPRNDHRRDNTDTVGKLACRHEDVRPSPRRPWHGMFCVCCSRRTLLDRVHR
jgi:phage shock protein C